MCEITEQDWGVVQTGINTCDECQSECLFEQVSPPPCRPWNPVHRGRLLFISEAPPVSGGFWQVGVKDNLRKNILELLRDHGLLVPSDIYRWEALGVFLSGGFFLVQTLKWPLAQRKRKQRPGFNQLGPAQKRRLIIHSVSARLRYELELIAPRGILALGNAAWQACVKLSQHPLTSQSGKMETLRCGDYQVVLPNGSIPLNVTYLPVSKIMKDQKKAKAVREDIGRFLNRHNWGNAQSTN